MEQLAFADYKALGPLQSPTVGDTTKVLKIGLAATGLRGDRSSPLQPSCFIKVQVKYVERTLLLENLCISGNLLKYFFFSQLKAVFLPYGTRV
jgi:hypothetical protein